MKVLITKRPSEPEHIQFKAEIDGASENWDNGATPQDALWNLARSHPQLFFEIEERYPQEQLNSVSKNSSDGEDVEVEKIEGFLIIVKSSFSDKYKIETNTVEERPYSMKDGAMMVLSIPVDSMTEAESFLFQLYRNESSDPRDRYFGLTEEQFSTLEDLSASLSLISIDRLAGSVAH